MGKQSTLQDFLIWGVKNYPANKYAVILWDHGVGAKGFGYDENNLSDLSLSIKEINGALKAASALQALNKKPTATGAEFGKAIAVGYKQQAATEGTDSQITLSVVDLSKVNAVNTALENFIKKASNDIKNPERITTVSKARIKAEAYGDASAHGGSTDMADIYDIAYNLKGTYPIEADKLMKSIKACITYKVTSDTKPNANGLSVYFPCQDKDNFKSNLQEYQNTGYSKSYQQFLATYVDRILADKEPIKLIQSNPNAGGEDSQSVFEIQIAQDDIGKINELYSVLAMPCDEEGIANMFLGMDMDVELDPETGIVKDNFTGYWTTLEGQFVSMYIETAEEDYSTYTIPAKLNGESVDIKVLYSEEYPDGVVLGAWRGIDEETGMPDKDIIVYVREIPLFLNTTFMVQQMMRGAMSMAMWMVKLL
ncbi:MAG: peptidase clostripain [Clostridia bacterium]|jgi:hypothetical protein|nr:peptidase clostripain [Clostridia bacterium]